MSDFASNLWVILDQHIYILLFDVGKIYYEFAFLVGNLISN